MQSYIGAYEQTDRNYNDPKEKLPSWHWWHFITGSKRAAVFSQIILN